MVAASRYAKQYDGFLAGAPGFNLPQAAVAQLWGVQQYAPISQMGANGRPDVWTSFLPADTALVSDKILAACDALDGVVDYTVSDPLACQSVFDIDQDVPTCSGVPDGTCLTYGQKSVLASVHAGAINSSGEALYTNFLWDVGIRAGGWRTWKFGNSTGNRDPLAVGFIFTTPPEDPAVLNGTGTTLLDYALNWNGAGFDVDEETLALEVIEKVGPGEHFLGERHTLRHMREAWTSRYMDKDTWEAWEEAETPQPPERAHDRASELLDTHEPSALPTEAEQRIREVIAEHERPVG